MYITYYQHWTRLIAIGIIPMLLIIYFNYKVQSDAKEIFDHMSVLISSRRSTKT